MHNSLNQRPNKVYKAYDYALKSIRLVTIFSDLALNKFVVAKVFSYLRMRKLHTNRDYSVCQNVKTTNHSCLWLISSSATYVKYTTSSLANYVTITSTSLCTYPVWYCLVIYLQHFGGFIRMVWSIASMQPLYIFNTTFGPRTKIRFSNTI